MRIAMIGGGYVGPVTGACFADLGMDATIVESDPAKLRSLLAGRLPIHEPGLDWLIVENVRVGRLRFGDDLPAAVNGADAVFIAVGTPTHAGDGHVDMVFVYAVAEQVARASTGYTVVATKSTVSVGTGRRLADITRKIWPGIDFVMASNPEFLREGSAIIDFMWPDRIVIGEESQRARAVLERIYHPLGLMDSPIHFTGIETAELTKYAANAFLATKVTFINEMANLCEKARADIHDVAKGMGMDGRISAKFLNPGPGFGGSCFPKDMLALARITQDWGAPLRLVEITVQVNEACKPSMAGRIKRACGGSVMGKTVAVLGLTFKPEADDMRDAPSIPIISRLHGEGAILRVFGPVGLDNARSMLPGGVIFCDDAHNAAKNADILVIVTE